MRSLLASLRRNAVASTALVVAVVGMPSAYAVATIRSADIVDGEVKAVDLGSNAVRSPKILDGSIGNRDLAPDAVTRDKIANGTILGEDIYDNSVAGADINESTLATVPSALQGGLGRYGYSGSCDPESHSYVQCSVVHVDLPHPGRLLIEGTVVATSESDSDRFIGACRINTTYGPIDATYTFVDGDAGTGWDRSENANMVAVSGAYGAGPIDVWVECNQAGLGAIEYPVARTVAVALSAG